MISGSLGEPVNYGLLTDEVYVLETNLDDVTGEIIQIKPEYDEVKRLADRTGKPLREIVDLVKKRAREVLL